MVGETEFANPHATHPVVGADILISNNVALEVTRQLNVMPFVVTELNPSDVVEGLV